MNAEQTLRLRGFWPLPSTRTAPGGAPSAEMLGVRWHTGYHTRLAGAQCAIAAMPRNRALAKENSMWGCSSAGRALRSQCRGQEFDPPQLHQSQSTAYALPARNTAAQGSATQMKNPPPLPEMGSSSDSKPEVIRCCVASRRLSCGRSALGGASASRSLRREQASPIQTYPTHPVRVPKASHWLGQAYSRNR